MSASIAAIRAFLNLFLTRDIESMRAESPAQEAPRA
jgi:hypothetical protein